MSTKSLWMIIPFIAYTALLLTAAYSWGSYADSRLRETKDIPDLDLSLSVANIMFINDSLRMFNKQYDSVTAENVDSYLKIILKTDSKDFSDVLWERYKRNNDLRLQIISSSNLWRNTEGFK